MGDRSYVGGSKSFETNPISENGLILSDCIMIILLEAFENANQWLNYDVITY